MQKYFVYLLESMGDGRFYIGQTQDISARLTKHNRGEVSATAGRKPLKLLGFVEVSSRSEALRLERSLKTHSDKKLKFIRKLKPDFEWRKK